MPREREGGQKRGLMMARALGRGLVMTSLTMGVVTLRGVDDGRLFTRVGMGSSESFPHSTPTAAALQAQRLALGPRALRSSFPAHAFSLTWQATQTETHRFRSVASQLADPLNHLRRLKKRKGSVLDATPDPTKPNVQRSGAQIVSRCCTRRPRHFR